MPNDPVLAILALLFLWLLVRRLQERGSGAQEEEQGRTQLKVRGRKGVKLIEALPSRPLAFAAQVTVADSADGGPTYTVDLGDLSCTCPDFRIHRSELPENAIGRVCAHVSEALRETGATGALDELLRAIIESGPTRMTYYQVPLRSGERVAIGHDPGSDQLDVIARSRPKDLEGADAAASYRRYGYSLSGGRWLVNERPPGSGEIREAIAGLPLEA